MPKVKRELYIELPPEDMKPGEENMVGRLNRNVYGFRDASSGWQEDWQELLKSEGYRVGVANPAPSTMKRANAEEESTAMTSMSWEAKPLWII